MKKRGRNHRAEKCRSAEKGDCREIPRKARRGQRYHCAKRDLHVAYKSCYLCTLETARANSPRNQSKSRASDLFTCHTVIQHKSTDVSYIKTQTMRMSEMRRVSTFTRYFRLSFFFFFFSGVNARDVNRRICHTAVK